MAKHRKKGSIRMVRKVLYDVINEVELLNGIQISQNNKTIEALAESIVATTKSVSYSEFLSELYYKATTMKETIISELTAASKNNSFFPGGYVLAINTWRLNPCTGSFLLPSPVQGDFLLIFDIGFELQYIAI